MNLLAAFALISAFLLSGSAAATPPTDPCPTLTALTALLGEQFWTNVSSAVMTPSRASAFQEKYPGFHLLPTTDGVRVTMDAAAEKHLTDFALDVALLSLIPGLPQENLFSTLDNFEPKTPSQTRALKLTRKMLDVPEGKPAGLFFHGTPGVGKTHLSVALAKEFLKRGLVPLYLTPDNSSNSHRDIPTHSVFIVDDFNNVYGLYRETFLKVLMRIHEHGGRVFVTSNTSFEKILDSILKTEREEGARYYDRIKGLFVPLQLEAPSARSSKSWMDDEE